MVKVITTNKTNQSNIQYIMRINFEYTTMF